MSVQLAERALKEREEAKATADLQAKLEAVTLAGQESKAQLEEARAENEKLKEALSRSTLRPTGEESGVCDGGNLKGADLFVAKRAMLRSVSVPLATSGASALLPQDKTRPSKFPAPKKIPETPVVESQVDEAPGIDLANVSEKTPAAEFYSGGAKVSEKAKKECQSSIFANLTKRRKEDGGSSQTEQRKSKRLLAKK